MDEITDGLGKSKSFSFCVYFMHQYATARITNTLGNQKVNVYDGTFKQLAYNEHLDITIQSGAVKGMMVGRDNSNNLFFTFNNIQGNHGWQQMGDERVLPPRTPFGTPFFTPEYTSKETPFSTAHSTPYLTAFRTAFSTPFKTAFSTQHSTPFSTPFMTFIKTPSQTDSSQPEPTLEPPTPSVTSETESKSSPNPLIPVRTIETTPEATWDGQYDDPPNVIIRGDDIPEIHETHPPIQTNFIKTDVPKKTTYVNVSVGTILIVVVVTLTVVNVVRSYKRIRNGLNDYQADDVDDLSIESEFFSSYETDDY
ncbi:hypothetical protein TVAG_146750 [Trichomonas vaginalis G3]|uniref:Uncharacterized protein n=1 Tax=Trichomonas vaginalis (strain ATCC PRA-98 / G3) TaxID=412133 RepID=A2DKX9_TRIV3|nr:bifunctional inhibitor/lipid-transfer protein/seed storage 2s albumin superfamily protein family [Trichomonas vaginalis G3]EAY18932.1 hypothetical protein TVAG_146750 [Trichomonas vaginalis G3]KAI5531994.1 bifunctional inhibitor/lipid-transfer protein/seed storage 2s albumin superfamily protein family [Trichomonas vaginalis G3]|eukprot:XP_001579918.1 hypothetical protein [Trichomonas vaginalis G3]